MLKFISRLLKRISTATHAAPSPAGTAPERSTVPAPTSLAKVAAPKAKSTERPPKTRRKLKRAARRAAPGAVRIDADGPLIAQARQAAK